MKHLRMLFVLGPRHRRLHGRGARIGSPVGRADPGTAGGGDDPQRDERSAPVDFRGCHHYGLYVNHNPVPGELICTFTNLEGKL